MKFSCFTALVVASLLILTPQEKLSSNDPRTVQLAKEAHTKGWIVFSARDAKGNWDLLLMRPDGSNRRDITPTPDFNETGRRFSPDGHFLRASAHWWVGSREGEKPGSDSSDGS